MSINVRRPPLSGRHLSAAEKPLTKFAISLGARGPDCAAGPDPEARCLGGPTARWGPGRASHRGRKSSGCSALLRRLPAHRRTSARARTLTHVHTQQKGDSRAACGGLVRAGKLLPRPPPRGAGPAHLLELPRGCANPGGPRPTGPGSAPPRSRTLPADARRLWAHHPRDSAPLLRRAPAKSLPWGSRIRPGLPTSRVSQEIKLLCLIIFDKIPRPYKPWEM